MESLFARIRWRLVGWNMLILALILALLGGTVYVALSRSLLEEVDRNLVSRSEQAIPALFPPRRLVDPDAGGAQVQGRANGPGPNGSPAIVRQRGPTEGYSRGVFFLALSPDGTVLANPQGVEVGDLPWPDSNAPTFATIQLADGDMARVVLRRAPDGGLLVTGQSLEPEQTALHSLVVVLVAGGALGLLLSLGAAWFLAGRALIPIQQAVQRQQEFVADASHELRTPLTVLRSATDLLNQHREEPLEANGELFDDVRAEITRMQRLAQDMLTLARSDAGGLELMTAPLQLGPLASDVVRRTMPLAVSQQVQLRAVDDAPDLTVDADPDRLQQVLLILIDNAIKHTPAGGTVEVGVRRHGGSAQLTVTDTGSGIAADDLPRIFDRFYRADKARARAQGGTGLGLAIARMLVEAHHGQVQIASTVGVGTHVTVLLPLVHPPAARLGGRLGELAAHLPHSAARQ
jgi:signal transduction histidine kinase